MHSLRLRLILIFVLLVTLTLGGFGVYTHVRLSNELENDFVAHQQKVPISSAGIGRTGAFIVIDIMLERVDRAPQHRVA